MATSAVAGLFSPGDGQAPIITAMADYLDSDDTSLFLRFQAIVRALQTPSGFTADMIVKVLQEVGELEHFNKIVSIELLFSVLGDQTRELAAAVVRAGGLGPITHPPLLCLLPCMSTTYMLSRACDTFAEHFAIIVGNNKPRRYYSK